MGLGGSDPKFRNSGKKVVDVAAAALASLLRKALDCTRPISSRRAGGRAKSGAEDDRGADVVPDFDGLVALDDL